MASGESLMHCASGSIASEVTRDNLPVPFESKVGNFQVDNLPGPFESKVGNFQVDYGSIEILESLGRGSAVSVNKAIWEETAVVVKTFPEPSNSEFQREVLTLSGLSHPNVVSLLCYAMDTRKCSIVLEFMDTDLYSVMQKRLDNAETDDCLPFENAEAVDIIHQIAEGMNYLHQKRIVHKDLKSLNVLVTGLKTGHLHVKMADFGLSKTKKRSITNSNLTPNTGTNRWMAPEVIQTWNNDGQVSMTQSIGSLRYPFKIDMYSFAMVCVEILTGEVPFNDKSSPGVVKQKVLKGDRQELPAHCPLELKALIEACWDKDPSTRPTFPAICEKLKCLKRSLAGGVLQWRKGVTGV